MFYMPLSIMTLFKGLFKTSWILRNTIPNTGQELVKLVFLAGNFSKSDHK